MNEPLKRRNLLAVAPTPTPASIPEAAIAAVAERNGFAAVPPPAAPVTSSISQADDPTPRRRQRQPTGRDHQFNVRLRKDTLDFIYSQSNARNIPVAQVIEEATEALKREQHGRS